MSSDSTPDLGEAAAGEERDGGVVMDMDNRVDIGAKAQDLSIEIVSDTGDPLAMQKPAGGDIGDHQVIRAHLLERDLGMLGIGDPVLEIRMRRPQRHVAQRVVDIAAPSHQARIAQELLGDRRLEHNGAGHGGSFDRSISSAYPFSAPAVRITASTTALTWPA